MGKICRHCGRAVMFARYDHLAARDRRLIRGRFDTVRQNQIAPNGGKTGLDERGAIRLESGGDVARGEGAISGRRLNKLGMQPRPSYQSVVSCRRKSRFGSGRRFEPCLWFRGRSGNARSCAVGFLVQLVPRPFVSLSGEAFLRACGRVGPPARARIAEQVRRRAAALGELGC